MKTRALLRLAFLAVPPALALGCSLINSYDDVLQSPSDAGGASDGTTPSGDSSSGDTGTPTDANPAVDSGTDAPITDADSAVPDDAQVGAVVAAARADKKDAGGSLEYVLSVLDPTNGKELSRESMAVIGSYFDGERDLWYIFEAPGALLSPGGPLVGPGDNVVLHVRQLDTHTGKWLELAKTPVPSMISSEQVAVLKQKLAYVAWSEDGGSGDQLVVLDTANAAQVNGDASADAATTADLPFNPIGLIGTRNAATGSSGGLITLIQETCDPDAGGCAFNIKGVTVGAAVNFKATHLAVSTSSTIATIGWGSYIGGGPLDLILSPNGIGGGIDRYSPLTNTRTADPTVSFAVTSNRFRPMAVSECFKTAFVVELNQTDLFAVPLSTGGTTSNIGIGHPGSQVAYEPFTNTILAPFSNNASSFFTAISVTGTPTAPLLAVSTKFKPPSDLRPYQVATRSPLDPLPFNCP